MIRSTITATAQASQKMFTYMNGPPSLKKFFTLSMKLPLEACGAAVNAASISRSTTVGNKGGVLSGGRLPPQVRQLGQRGVLQAPKDARNYVVRRVGLSRRTPDLDL